MELLTQDDEGLAGLGAPKNRRERGIGGSTLSGPVTPVTRTTPGQSECVA